MRLKVPTGRSATLARTLTETLNSPVRTTQQLPGKERPKKSTPSSGPTISGGGSGFPRRNPDSSAVPIDGHFSGDGTVPASALAVETVDGRIAYEGTPEEPILKYENCLVLNKAGKQTTKFWTVNLLGVEQEGLKNTKKPIATVTSPVRETLPRLPVWGSPNGWDHWGRPWAYMDAPHNSPDLKVMSVHEPHAARITTQAARQVLPRFFGSTTLPWKPFSRAGRPTATVRLCGGQIQPCRKGM